MVVLSPDVVQENGPDDVPIILNPPELPSYLGTRVRYASDSVIIDGTSYPLAGHTFILTGQDWNDIGKYMVVVTDDGESLPRLGQLVPHYGKYSFLVFNGARNIGKGNWTVEKSPLKKAL